MIKSEIRSLVKNSLKKYDQVARYHDRVIDANIEFVLHQMLGEVFRMNPLSLQRHTRGYGYTVPLTVLSEASSGIYYTTLPENIYIFGDKASGVRRVAPATQTGCKFYPMDQREWDLALTGLYINSVKDKIGYIVTPARVEYYGMTGAIITSGVRMDLLVPFSEFTDTEIVPYPEHATQEGLGLFDRVIQRLVNIPTVDLRDDNSDKETQK